MMMHQVTNIPMKLTTKHTFQFYFKHLKKHPWLSLSLVFFIVVGVAASLVTPFVYKELIDVIAGEGSREAMYPQLIGILFVILWVDIIGWAAWKIAVYSMVYLQPKIMAEITKESFNHLHKHSYNFFNNQFVGSLVKRVNRIRSSFEDIMDRFAFDLLPTAIRVVVVAVVLFSLHFALGFAVLIWSIGFLALNYFLSLYKLKRFDLPKVQADTRLTGRLADTITNNVNIKLFAALTNENKGFDEANQNWYNKTLSSWLFSGHIEAIQGALMVALNFFVIYFAIKLWVDGVISIGDFVLLQAYLLEIFRQLWDFGRVIRTIYERLADAEEMIEIFDMPFEVKDAPKAKELIVSRGKIEFKKVSFSYNDKNGVLNALNFRVKPGEKIALIGPSGGGKSTIVKLLLRLFDLKRGSIWIDDQNIAKVTQDSLRSAIALVPQDPILFHRSLYENIRYGRFDASDEEVFAAAKLAYCHDFIMSFPDGYKTFVGERGVKLSGGQRQRIAIARAILSNTRILILDEATSSLDSESEKLIQDALLNLMKNKTTFVIAHRLSTIVNVDKILVLEDGAIIEEGSHAILMKKEGSLYKKLWELQVGGYLD